MIPKSMFFLFLLLALSFSARADGVNIKVANAWIREVIPGQDTTAAYLVIENPDRAPDFLVSGSCDCAQAMEIHRMIQGGGRMRMEPVTRLEIPAGGKVELVPGGTHIMLFGVRGVLKEGTKVTLKLHFERAGNLSVEAEVKASEGKKNVH